MQMPQALLNRIIKIFTLTLFIALIFSGCSNKVDKIIVGDWLLEISNKLNIKDYSKESPYFLNIDKSSIYFDSVQALVEWGVINNSTSINTEDYLTREFVAYTLSNLFTEEINASSIKDSNKSKYSKQIEKSVALGIMQLDSRECFNPKKLIDKKEALSILDKVVNTINFKVYENSFYEHNWNNELELIEEIPIEFDKQEDIAYFKEDVVLNKDDIVYWKDDDLEYYKKIEEINHEEGKAKLIDPSYDDIYDSLNIQDSFIINFDNAFIEEDNELESFKVNFDDAEIEDLIQPIDLTYDLNNSLKKLSNKKGRSFEFNGFNVTYEASGNSINVSLRKVNESGSIIYGNASLYDVKPTFKWKSDKDNIEEGYFRIDFKTNSSLGLKNEKHSKLFSDLNEVTSNNFIGSLKKSFKEEKDLVETIIPICKITVPIPNVPTLKIVMQLQVEIYVSGRIELSLYNTSSVGMQIKNNKLRLISDHNYDSDFIVKASGDLLLGLYAGLNAANISLMDITVSSGVKTKLDSILHIFDNKGKHVSLKSDLPTDLLDDVIGDNKNIKLCADLKGYWLLDIVLNSPKTFANRLGLNKKINVLNESNASLFPGMIKHLENWQFVDKCTIKDRYYALNEHLDVNTEKILINQYSSILKTGSNFKIKILKLPDGYTNKDLIFESNNNNIAIVDNEGRISAINKGNTIITIRTKDDIFITKYHVLVKE